MEDLEFVSSTHIRRAQWVATTCELRVGIGDATDDDLRWYAYHGVPASVFEGLRAQELGARLSTGKQPKGAKPYSVGTYFHAHLEGKYGETPVDGPWTVH